MREKIQITHFSTFLLIATMLSTRLVILLLCITLAPVLARRRHYLIETEDEEGNELSKVNSTFPDGPSKSHNRAQSARINQYGYGDQYANIVQGTGSGGCPCTFKGKPCFRGGSGGKKNSQ